MKAVLAQDAEKIRNYFSKDAYVNWHCTNEHFTVDEFIIANCEYPGDWDGTIERVEQSGNLYITVTKVYPKDKNFFPCCIIYKNRKRKDCFNRRILGR